MYEPEWTTLQESCVELTDFEVGHRYPGSATGSQDAADAVEHVGRIRKTAREFFRL